jgi:FtsH-binding integral membrane protein
MKYYNSETFKTDQEKRIEYAIHVVKTVQLLLFQFLFTFGISTIVAFSQLAYIFTHLYYVELVSIGGLGGLITIIYICMSSKKTEQQLIIFTIFETMVICAASSMYGQNVVLMSILSMIGIMCGLGTYALTTSTNHTGLQSILFSSLSCLLMMSFVNIFLGSQIVRIFELYVGTLIFFAYIVFDVQYYLSEHYMTRHNRDDLHVEAALNIYLDGLNIFVRFLEIFSSSESNDSNKSGRSFRKR